MREIRISDVTMRRAIGMKEMSLSFKEKLEIAKILDHLGVSTIEVEGIENAKADSLRIKSLASLVRNSALGVPVKLDAENVELVWSALKDAVHPRLIVKAAVSPARMEYVYRKKNTDIEIIEINMNEHVKKMFEIIYERLKEAENKKRID